MLRELKGVRLERKWRPGDPENSVLAAAGIEPMRARFSTLMRGDKCVALFRDEEALESEDSLAPVLLLRGGGRQIFKYQGRYYEADEDLTAEDVDALINEAANKKRLKLQKAHALKAMTEQLDGKARRQAIPQDVKVLVWQRDGGRCVECGSNAALEYDHIIPLAMGGSNTDRNLQLLCEACNRRKGASLG